jgi:hypothetical protein
VAGQLGADHAVEVLGDDRRLKAVDLEVDLVGQGDGVDLAAPGR